GCHHRRPGGGDELRPDQDRLAVALRPVGQVQPAAAHRTGPGAIGTLFRRRGAAALMRRLGASLLAFLLLARVAGAQTELQPGYDDRPPRGPQVALGMVIWNHGLGSDREASGPTPFLIDDLQEAGYDVVRL